YLGRVPDRRTVQRIVKASRPHDSSGPWVLRDADPEHARVVLETLAAVIQHTEGRIVELTRAEAERVVFLHRAAPDLPPLNGWSLAQVYALREARADSVADLDHLLAFAPWRHGKPGWDRYDHAIAAGWIVEAPLYVTKPLRTG